MPRKPPTRGRRGSNTGRFNEAAARCRGNLRRHLRAIRAAARFNEAAARCRGNRLPRGRAAGAVFLRFNEAAARCRGNPIIPPEQLKADAASMRPRPDAAETQFLGEHVRLRAGLQ